MNKADQFIEKRLKERRESGAYRQLKTENTLVDFCSNDYLGFGRSVELKQKIDAELAGQTRIRNGSTGSRLISGSYTYTQDLEKQIAAYHDVEAALLFNSGYDANVGLLSSLPQRGDTIITDELIHASAIDGARLSHANRYSFKHNDLTNLEAKLKNATGACYVLVESVYSMDGDSPPVADILNLTEKYGANLIVDEAHALGLYPKGLTEALNLADRVFARLFTFGKAMGCHGAVIVGNNNLREYLINFSRSFIYTTAAPIHQLAAIKMAYEQLPQAADAVQKLKSNINLFKNGYQGNACYPLINSDTAIQCIVLKSNERTRKIAEMVQKNGFDVRPILSPTVPAGSERVRICLHAFNTNEEISALTKLLNNLINE